MKYKPRIKDNTLIAKWALDDGKYDLCGTWGKGCYKSDLRIAFDRLSPLLKELEDRGYDLNTLEFSIKKK